MSGYRQSMEKFFYSLGSWAFRHRFVSTGIALAVLIATASQVPKLDTETSILSMFHENDPARVVYEDFQEQFGKDDVLIVALEPENVFDRDFLKTLAGMHAKLEEGVPYLDEITSLVNVRRTRGKNDELIVEDLMPEVPADEAAMARLKKTVLSSPLYRNLLVSADGTLTTIMLKPDVFKTGDTDAGGESKKVDTQEFIEIFEKVREICDPYGSKGINIYYAGHPVIAAVLQDAMQRDIGLLMPLSLLFVTIFLAALFRRVTGVLYPFLIVIFAVVSTLGMMAVLKMPMTNVASGLPNFLIAVGIADAVHILALFYRMYRDTGDRHGSVAGAFGHSGLAVLLTSLTTAGGLLSLAVADVSWVADYGVIVPIGVMFALFYTVLLLPGLLALFPVKRPAMPPEGKKPAADRLLIWIGDFSVKRPWTIVAVWTLLLLVTGAGLMKVRLSQDSMKWYPEDHPIRVATEVIDTKLKGTLTLEVMLDTGKKDGVYKADLMKRLDKTAVEMEKDSGARVPVGKVITVSGIIKEVNQAINENKPGFYKVPDSDQLVAQEMLLFEMSGSDDLENLVSTDISKTRMTLTVPFSDASEYVELWEKLKLHLAERYSDLKAAPTGMVGLFITAMWNILKSMVKSYPIALIVVSLLMILLIGRVKIGLLSMLPNIAPILIMTGFMGWIDIPFDITTMLIASIAIGLIVDDTIHFLHTFAREHEKTGDVAVAVRDTLLTTGRAIFVTSLTLAAGFLVFLAATLKNLSNFGLITACTVMVAMLADFFLVPAIMTIVFRRR